MTYEALAWEGKQAGNKQSKTTIMPFKQASSDEETDIQSLTSYSKKADRKCLGAIPPFFRSQTSEVSYL